MSDVGVAEAPAAGANVLRSPLEALGLGLARAWADRYLRWALALSFAALVLRALWVLYANPDPLDGRFDDTVFYDASARALANGKGFISFAQKPTAQWPIGYPGLIALIYVLFGQHLVAAKALNVFLGAATVLGVYFLGSKVFDKRVGLAAAALLAFFPSQVFFSTLLMTEVLFTALLVLMAYLVARWTLEDPRPPAYRLLALGVLMGYMAIVRGEGSVLIGGVVLLWWVVLRSWRRVLRPVSLLVAGVLLVIMPWTVRNLIQMDAPVLISTAVGSALWQGHHQGVYDPNDIPFPTKFYDRYSDVPYPRREILANNAAIRDALDFIVHNPGEEARLLAKKAYHLFREDAIGLVWIEANGTRDSVPQSSEEQLATVANAYYFVVLGWVALTVPFWFSLSDRRRLLLLVLLLVWTGNHLVFIPNPRYHFPLVPIFAILAAQGALVLWGRLRAARAKAS